MYFLHGLCVTKCLGTVPTLALVMCNLFALEINTLFVCFTNVYRKCDSSLCSMVRLSLPVYLRGGSCLTCLCCSMRIIVLIMPKRKCVFTEQLKKRFVDTFKAGRNESEGECRVCPAGTYVSVSNKGRICKQ